MNNKAQNAKRKSQNHNLKVKTGGFAVIASPEGQSVIASPDRNRGEAISASDEEIASSLLSVAPRNDSRAVSFAF